MRVIQLVDSETSYRLAKNKINLVDLPVLVLGFTFKENCPDIRNSKVVRLVTSLQSFGFSTDISDYWVDPDVALKEYSLRISKELPSYKQYGAIVVAVSHSKYIDLDINRWRSLLRPNGVILDLKGIVPRELNPLRP